MSRAEANRKRWSDPVARAKMGASVRAAWAERRLSLGKVNDEKWRANRDKHIARRNARNAKKKKAPPE